jgi:monoamine oxidase
MSQAATDVIVIGAGAAGLAAAGELAAAGKNVLILEARDRIGGRIWTRREAGLTAPVELGAEFIHGHAARTHALLARAGVAAVESAGSRWTLREGTLESSDDWFLQVLQAISATDALIRQDMSFDDFVAGPLGALPADARLAARTMAEGFDAADTSRASARAIVSEWTGDTLGEVPQSRPAGGYASLLESLMLPLRAAGVRLQLQSPVQALHWSRGAVAVRGRTLGTAFEVHAPRVVVTLPLGVLQHSDAGSGAISFTPALGMKRTALGGLASGAIIKLLLRFGTPFWRSARGGRYRDGLFFQARGAEIPTFWTSAPDPSALLVAWAGGPRALRLSAHETPPQMVRAALGTLQSLFGAPLDAAACLQGYYYHDWQQDPYARGAYSYVLVGGEDARRALGEPVEDTLFFAGEATDTSNEAGTVTGALESGVRAAREALRPWGLRA